MWPCYVNLVTHRTFCYSEDHFWTTPYKTYKTLLLILPIEQHFQTIEKHFSWVNWYIQNLLFFSNHTIIVDVILCFGSLYIAPKLSSLLNFGLLLWHSALKCLHTVMTCSFLFLNDFVYWSWHCKSPTNHDAPFTML